MSSIKLEIHGDNRGTITDFTKATIGTVNITPGKQDQGVPIELEKKGTTIGKMVGKKLVEFLLGILSGVATKWILDYLSKNSIKAEFGIALLILMVIFAVAAIVLIMGALLDLIMCTKVSKKGAFVALSSKADLTGQVMNIFSKDKTEGAYKPLGKVYKNLDGTVYEFIGCKCPVCKSAPIGKMRFRYNKNGKTYELVCNENKAHILSFDYKELW